MCFGFLKQMKNFFYIFSGVNYLHFFNYINYKRLKKSQVNG